MTTTAHPINVLHVDDDPAFADLVATSLEREDDRLAVRTATDPDEALAALSTADVDCIVSDYDMPGTNGIEFLEAVRAADADLPFILYTGKGSEEIASEAISAGVTDYLQKEGGTSQYAVLANRITNAVEQYRSTRAFEASQQRLSLFFEQSPLGVIEWDEDFTVTRVNEAAEGILGYDEADLLGESWAALVPGTDRDVVGDVVDELLEGDGGFHSVNENVRADGERIVCEWHNRVVTDDGEVVAIFSQFQDVTERRAQQTELERHRAAVQAATNTIVTVDEAGVVQSVNPAVEDTFGYAPEELVGEPVTTLMGPDVAERHRAAFDRYLDTGAKRLDWEYAELEGRHRDGSPVPLSVTLGEVTHDGERRFVGILSDVSERAAQEAALREQERRYQAVFNDPNILVGLLDTDGTVLDVNDTAREYVDAPLADLRGEPFWETPWFAHAPGVRTDVRAWIERAAAGDYVEFEADLVRPDGEPYTVEGVFRPVTDADGEIDSLLVSTRDVTEETARERELEWTNAVLSTLLETLPVGVLAEDGDRTVLAANERAFELFDLGGLPDDVVGADCERLAERVSGLFADPAGFVDRIDEIVAADVPVHGEELSLADGRTFSRSHEPIELPDGEGHLWTYRDVTAQKAYEGRLEALNEMGQALLTADSRRRVAEIGVDAARDVLNLEANAIHLADDDGAALVPVASTDALADLIGDAPTFTDDGTSIAWRAYERGEAVAVDDVHDDPDVYNPDSPLRSELHLPLGDHGILVAGSPTPGAFDQEDLVLGRILAGSIVTALEQIEGTERLRAREAELTRQNERLEEFASIVSHDLRNPLTVAEGRLELARAERDSDHLASVARAHDRMDALIDDLLTLAREGDHVSDREAVDLGAIARGCWETVATGDATLTVASDRTLRADRSRLQQLLENLMRNAVEHGSTGSRSADDDAGEHGSTDSRSADDDAEGQDGADVAVTVGALPDGFYVEDDGPGIPPADREAVFEPGCSTGEGGTGFGLSIVRQIVDAHGWDIAIRDGTAGGARFEITGVPPEE